LAAVLTGRREPPHWSHEDSAFEIWDLKSLMEDVSARVHGPLVSVVPGEPQSPVVNPESAMSVTGPDGDTHGYGGMVRDEAVDLPVWAGDVWVSEITFPNEAREVKPVTFEKLPQFPAAERDLALFVPDGVGAEAVSDVIRQGAGKDLESIELFDLYVGEGVPEGARSLAFRLRFRSSKRTLKDKEVDRSVNAVLKRLEEEVGVKARG